MIYKTFSEQVMAAMTAAMLISYVCVVGVCVYWYLDDQHPIEEIEGRFLGWDDVNPRVAWIEWSGVRTRSCEGSNTRMIVNGTQEDLPSKQIVYNGPVSNPERKRETWRNSFELPPQYYAYQEHPKKAKYRARWEYWCNVWQRRISPLVVYPPDIEFEIPGVAENEFPTAPSPKPRPKAHLMP